LQPDGTVVPLVLPFDIPEARIVDSAAGGEEPQESPPYVRQPLKAPRPAPPPQAVKPPPEPQEPPVGALARLLKDEKEAESALRLLDRYEPATRDWFVRLLPMLASLNKTPIGSLSAEEVAHMQEQLQGLLLALCVRAPLVLENMCYCEPEPDPERRGGYRFRRLPQEHPFLPPCGGLQSEGVCLYIELRNLGTVPDGSFSATRPSPSPPLLH